MSADLQYNSQINNELEKAFPRKKIVWKFNENLNGAKSFKLQYRKLLKENTTATVIDVLTFQPKTVIGNEYEYYIVRLKELPEKIIICNIQKMAIVES
jgi:hypothetical protein